MNKIELVIYDSSRWYSIFSAYKPTSVAVRYDNTYFVVFNNGRLRKVKADKVVRKSVYETEHECTYTEYLVGKMWLDDSISRKTKFSSEKEFTKLYVDLVFKNRSQSGKPF